MLCKNYIAFLTKLVHVIQKFLVLLYISNTGCYHQESCQFHPPSFLKIGEMFY